MSLRPSTVRAIERDLRQFGHDLAQRYPEIGALAQLTRAHLEAYKQHLARDPRPSGRHWPSPASRTS